MNKLEERFSDLIKNRAEREPLLTSVASDIMGVSCASLTKDVAVKFAEWSKNHSWELDYREQITHTEEQLFDYFITNIYKP